MKLVEPFLKCLYIIKDALPRHIPVEFLKSIGVSFFIAPLWGKVEMIFNSVIFFATRRCMVLMVGVYHSGSPFSLYLPMNYRNLLRFFQLEMLITSVFCLYIHLCSKWLIIHLGQGKDAPDHIRSKYTLLRDVEDAQVGLYDKPLPCFGCGIGWFSWVLWNSLVYLHFMERLSLPTSSFSSFLILPLYLSFHSVSSWGFFSHCCGTMPRFSTSGMLAEIQGNELD